MSWWNNDWNGTPDQDNGSGQGGDSGGSRGPMIWRLKLPYGMDKGRDILYLDDNIFRFWEHHGQTPDGKWSPGITGVCRRKNSIGDGACPVCDEDYAHYQAKKKGIKPNPHRPINLYNIGFTTGIDISFGVGKQFQRRDGTTDRNYYLCERRLIPMKRGSQDYPGALADIARIREREGRLRGLVVHQIRKGKKSPTIGDSFEVVERLDPTPEAMQKYLVERVRQMFQDGSVKMALQEKDAAMPSKEWFREKMMQRLELDAAPYQDIFVPMDAGTLAQHFGLAWTPSQGEQGGAQQGGGQPDMPDDPFSYGDDPFGGAPDPTQQPVFDEQGNPKGPGYEDDDMPF